LNIESKTEAERSGASIRDKLSPDARIATSSKDLLSFWNKLNAAIRADMGIAIGKIVGIWYSIKSIVFEKSLVSAVNLAMSLKRATISTAMNVPTDRTKTLV
jgi:hypothetical protein